MIESEAVNMRRRVEVGFDELRLGDTVQHWCKRGVSAAKVVHLTFKGCGKVESFQVESDPSNYYKLAFLRAWTYVPYEDMRVTHSQPSSVVDFPYLRHGDEVTHLSRTGTNQGIVDEVFTLKTGESAFRMEGETNRGVYYTSNHFASARRFKVEMVEFKIDNEAFEKELKRKQILAMMDACQNAGIELRSTGMNIYDVVYALYEAGFRK